MTQKTVLFVQPVFLPDQTRLERNIASIRSLFNYVNANALPDDILLTVVIGGWAKTDDLWNEFLEKCSTIHQSLVPYRFNRNYGKALVINSLVKRCVTLKCQFTYIMSCDSDIVFDATQNNFFERLIQSAIASEQIKKQPFGLVGLNQSGDSRHNFEHFKESYEYTNVSGQKEVLTYPDKPAGIAGGAIFLSAEAFKKVNGYRIMGVYAGDDAYLLQDLENAGYSYGVLKSLFVIHPEEDDADYEIWKESKLDVCRKENGKPHPDKIDEFVKDSEEFWESR